MYHSVFMNSCMRRVLFFFLGFELHDLGQSERGVISSWLYTQSTFIEAASRVTISMSTSKSALALGCSSPNGPLG